MSRTNQQASIVTLIALDLHPHAAARPLLLPEQHLVEDCDMGVLDAVAIHRTLEQTFGIHISDDEFEAAETVGKLTALVEMKIAALAAATPEAVSHG